MGISGMTRKIDDQVTDQVVRHERRRLDELQSRVEGLAGAVTAVAGTRTAVWELVEHKALGGLTPDDVEFIVPTGSRQLFMFQGQIGSNTALTVNPAVLLEPNGLTTNQSWQRIVAEDTSLTAASSSTSMRLGQLRITGLSDPWNFTFDALFHDIGLWRTMLARSGWVNPGGTTPIRHDHTYNAWVTAVTPITSFLIHLSGGLSFPLLAEGSYMALYRQQLPV